MAQGDQDYCNAKNTVRPGLDIVGESANISPTGEGSKWQKLEGLSGLLAYEIFGVGVLVRFTTSTGQGNLVYIPNAKLENGEIVNGLADVTRESLKVQKELQDVISEFGK